MFEDIEKELQKLSLEEIELLFRRIISQRKKEIRNKQLYSENIIALYNSLSQILNISNEYKKKLLLFDLIIDNDDSVLGIEEIVNNLTISQLLNGRLFRKFEHMKNLKNSSIENYKRVLSEYYQRYGKKIVDPAFVSVIRNALITKQLVSDSIKVQDILKDIKMNFNI